MGPTPAPKHMKKAVEVESANEPAAIPEQPLQESDFDEPAVLLNLRKTYHEGIGAHDLYEVARGEWRMRLERAQHIGLVLAVFSNRVVEVYRAAAWFPAGTTMMRRRDWPGEPGRLEFVGNIAPNEIRQKYLGRFTADLASSQNPVRYIWPEGWDKS